MAFLDNLSAHWKFDEASGNAVDSSGNSNTLTNQNTTPFATGKVNNGANLVRANSNYFSITDANQTGLDLTGDCSFAFYIKMTSQPTGSNVFSILRKWDESNEQRSYTIAYFLSGGVMRLQVGISDDGLAASSTDIYYLNTTFSNGIIYHILINFDASAHRMEFIINGELVGYSNGSQGYTSIHSGSAAFIVGAYIDATPTQIDFLDGLIDELYIWSRIVSKEEIRKYILSVDVPRIPMPTFFNL